MANNNWSWHADLRQKPASWKGQPLRRPLVVEEKKDGFRCTVERRDGDHIVAYGRKEHIALDLAENVLARVKRWPEWTVLDGELYAPGEPATEVASMIARRSSKLVFWPFAAPFIAGNDARYWSFEQVDDHMTRRGYPPPNRLSPSLWGGESPMMDALIAQARAWGVEGWVLKQWHYAGWYKCKPVDTVDLVVIGAKPGKGKHAGRWGSLQCEGDVNVGKGNDEQWRDLPLDQLVGRVVEISHEGRQANGGLRFSSFVRWRDDK